MINYVSKTLLLMDHIQQFANRINPDQYLQVAVCKTLSGVTFMKLFPMNKKLRLIIADPETVILKMASSDGPTPVKFLNLDDSPSEFTTFEVFEYSEIVAMSSDLYILRCLLTKQSILKLLNSRK